MESPEPAENVAALEAELAAKSSRIAELEARVSTLEAENSRLRKAMAKEEAAGLPGEEDPIFGRLDEDSGGHKQMAAEKLGGGADCDVVVLSDGEEGIAADANKRMSTEEGVVIPTPRKRAVRVVAAESEDEAVGDAEGGGESDKGNARCDNGVDLEDDDVSVTPRGKKRAAALVVSSDSEDEDVNAGDPGRAKDDGNAKEDDMPSRKRALRGVSDSEEEDGNDGVHVAGSKCPSHLVVTDTESDDEDDRIPICQVLKKIRKDRLNEDADYDELGEAKGCSTSATRRSARSVKNQSKKGRAVRRMLHFGESDESEGSDDDDDDNDDMGDFINDENSPERASGSAEESCSETNVSGASGPNEELSPKPQKSDSEINYADVIASIGRKKKTKDWKLEGEMLAAFEKHPELCLKAVCALYRRQTEDEQRQKATFVHNKEGFSQIDARRASWIAEFLLDGDPYGPLKKTVQDLESYDRYALNFCRKVASRYSKQLFAIYQSQEDPHFHP
ncbi:hypothetical protein EJB05_32650 [Eragrostis curvula]|uniref:Uncharacterized protein n=1 Tax=Eragrostis curvula TaxID=38414 RepID=A0A5J9UHK3_9POAL|nr:hypothetical protein EJB05_32635 [Eragrostis curvula]TVU22929.1 hypothetical protein EJB05_32650 [Eragrostis curvula]